MPPKTKTIDSFFKRKHANFTDSQTSDPTNLSSVQLEQPTVVSEQPVNQSTPVLEQSTSSEQPPSKLQKREIEAVDISSLVRDPGLRPPMWDYPINQQDEIRREYIRLGPYQHVMADYPLSNDAHRRKFQAQWFKSFPWLEYSPFKDAAFCFPCYLFTKKPSEKHGYDTFITTGFKKWKKVNCGKDCALLKHIGQGSNSSHRFAINCLENLKDQSCHIEKVMEKQTSQQILENRLRLKTSIDAVRWLTFQACAFRGHDERPNSVNRGNFLEMIELLSSYNEKVKNVVLENAPQNAKYTSPTIQKQILHVYARNVQSFIRREIGDAKFCIIVDEARDEAKKEQMAIVVRFVDIDGFIKERFLDIVHVKDTSALTLKDEIYSVLSRHSLDIQNIRGQGYDGASNMRGEWNGLQALFLKECPYAYYVHCLAHQLQLALVAASREVTDVHTFFQNLNFVINIVGSSCKRNDELQKLHADEIAHLIAIDELDTGRGVNQSVSLQRPGDTRWSSHFHSVCSLIKMYGAVCSVLGNIASDGSTYSQRGDATFAVKLLMSFEFAFILHIMKHIMGITDMLCQALQQKSQDIINAMNLVASTKHLIQKLRDDGWENVLKDVNSFCKKHDIEVPEMTANFSDILRSRRKKSPITVEHHYRVDIFTATIDHQLQELNNRFSERTTELLILSAALDPTDGYKLFNIEDICKLVDKFYPQDFSDQEKIHLRFQLEHYELDVPKNSSLKNLSTVADLCRGLVETRKSNVYPLIDRLLRLVLTLPVSTATTERAFSSMKIVKTRLRSKMEDDFLTDYLIVYIEREVAEKFNTDMIIDYFYSMKERRAQLK